MNVEEILARQSQVDEGELRKEIEQEALNQFIEFESQVHAFQAFNRVTGWTHKDLIANPQVLPEVMQGIWQLADRISSIEIEWDQRTALQEVEVLANGLFDFLPPLSS